MILPIRAIGDPVLKRKAIEITKEFTELDTLIENMFDTMYNASGIGLAAPQVGVSARLFILDTSVSLKDDEDSDEEAVKEVFINAKIESFFGDDEPFEEGCLSIPNIREDVYRPEGIVIKYLDRNFKPKTLEVDGLLARVIQHEYDHVDGVLFTDLIPPVKKRLLRSKLDKIAKGKVRVPYPMRFPDGKKGR